MIKKRWFILISLVSLSLLLFVGYHVNTTSKSNIINTEEEVQEEQPKEQQEDDEGNRKNTTITSIRNDEILSNIEDKNNITDIENNKDTEIEIFGTWYLERVVLKSEAYDGTDLEALGGIDEEDYVGLELEYADKYIRLGENEYQNPKYTLDYRTPKQYNRGGGFKEPNIYSVIESESISVLDSDKYEWLSEVPLRLYLVDFQDKYILPVGAEAVMLDNDTILVGIWGKILLAHRIE